MKARLIAHLGMMKQMIVDTHLQKSKGFLLLLIDMKSRLVRTVAFAGMLAWSAGGASAADTGVLSHIDPSLLDIESSAAQPDGALLPTPVFAGFLGGTSTETWAGVATDHEGYIYVAGHALSGWSGDSFPGCPPFEYYMSDFIFLSRIAPDGSQLLYTTCLEQHWYDSSNTGTPQLSLAVVEAGSETLVVLATEVLGDEHDLPVTDAVQPFNHGGETEIYIAAYEAETGALRWATYFGGVGMEGLGGIAASGDRIYLVGSTDSAAKFPIPSTYTNPFQSKLKGPSDAFVAVLDSSGHYLHYTFFGGYDAETGLGIAVDAGGDVYVVGGTFSPGLPITKDAYDDTCGVDGECDSIENPLLSWSFDTGFGADAFVAIFGPDLGQRHYATYLGGSQAERAWSIGIDAQGRATVAGATYSGPGPGNGPDDFPIQGGCVPLPSLPGTHGGCLPSPAYDPFGTSHGAGIGKPFATRFEPNPSEIEYSTFLGGAIVPWGPLPLTPDGSLWLSRHGTYEKLDPFGTQVVFSVELVEPVGHHFNWRASKLRVDAGGDLHVVDRLSFLHHELSLFGEPFQPEFGGGVLDFYVARIAECRFGLAPESAWFDSAGGSAQFEVATSLTDCTWTAETDADWIHLSAPSGKGPGAVSYTVDPNVFPASRTGTITLADRVIYVDQAGAPEPSTETKGGNDDAQQPGLPNQLLSPGALLVSL